MLNDEKLMEQVSDLVDGVLELTSQIRAALANIARHNADRTAHPDIRRAIGSGGGGSGGGADLSAVHDIVDDHNVSQASHADLRSDVTGLIDSIDTVMTRIVQSINTHNLDAASHKTISDRILSVSGRLDSFNLALINQRITDIINVLMPDLRSDLTELDGIVADHERRLAATERDIDTIKLDVSVIDKSVDAVATSSDKVYLTANHGAIGTDALYAMHALGLGQVVVGAPNMIGFKHTFPEIVYPGQEVTFIMTGAEVDDGQTVAYSIESLSGLFFSKTDGIGNDEVVTCTVSAAAVPDTVALFKVVATNTATNKEYSFILASRIAKEIDISRVVVSFPASVEPGMDYVFAARYLGDGESYSFGLDPSDSLFFFSKDSGIKSREAVNVEIPENAPRGETVKFILRILDAGSRIATKEVFVKINQVPGAEDFRHTLPTRVTPNKTILVSFSGIVSSKGNKATYSLLNIPAGFTFSKTNNIVDQEQVSLTLSSTLTRGQKYSVTVRSRDEFDATIDLDISTKINDLPVSSHIATTIPTTLVGGIYNAVITGATDPDGDPVTYSIENMSSNISVSQTTDISENQNLTFTVSRAQTDPGEAYSFYIYATDSLGEKSTPKVISGRIDPIFVTETPQIISPADGSTVEGQLTLSWTPYTKSILK